MELITSRVPDGEYIVGLKSFLDAAAGNAGVLGLTPSEIEALVAEVDLLETSMVNVVTARAAYSASVTAKEEQLDRVRRVVAMLAASWRANPAIPDEVLDELMVAPHKVSRRNPPPAVVTDLVLTATGGGLVTLRWSANGNLKGTVYQIEVASSGEGSWVLLDTVTARKFSRVFEPGEPVWLRVRAKRGSRVSGASNPVSMWAGSVRGLRAAA